MSLVIWLYVIGYGGVNLILALSLSGDERYFTKKLFRISFLNGFDIYSTQLTSESKVGYQPNFSLSDHLLFSYIPVYFLIVVSIWTLNIMSIRGLLSLVSFLNRLEMVSHSANHAAKLVDKLLTVEARLFSEINSLCLVVTLIMVATLYPCFIVGM